MAVEPEQALSRVYQIAQPVTDLGRAVEFYREVLGARHVATFDPPGLAFFDFDGIRLMLDAVGEIKPPGSPLYFAVDDVHAAFATLVARGAEPLDGGAPHMINRDDSGVFGVAGTETWMGFVKDPDGNVLAVAADVGP